MPELPMLDSRGLPLVSLLVLGAASERVPRAPLIADDEDECAVWSLADECPPLLALPVPDVDVVLLDW